LCQKEIAEISIGMFGKRSYLEAAAKRSIPQPVKHAPEAGI